jgi:tyrosine-specific transport protein
MKLMIFFEGVAMLIGTIIGSGYLVLPYSFLQAGVWQNIFWLAFFAFCVTVLHLLYGEIVVATEGQHRLPGYVKKYLGEWAEGVVTVSFLLGIFGGLVVYLLLGVHFLGQLAALFGGLPYPALLFLFWLIGVIMLFANFKFSTKINLVLTISTLTLFAVISALGLLRLNPEHFLIAPTKGLFFPFGLVLYALIGSLAIPEIINLLRLERQNLKLIKPIALLGTAIPVLIYLFFALGIFGVSGPQTSQDAFSGLAGFLPGWLIYAALLMAFLEIITSYFAFEVSVFQTLKHDFKFTRPTALLLVALLPVAMFSLGVYDFVKVMGFMGAALTSLDSIFVILVYLSLPRKIQGYSYQVVRLPKFVAWAMIGLLVIGGVAGSIMSL